MQVKLMMQEKAIDASEEISIDGISSPIAQHILDFCDDGETDMDLFSITGTSQDPPATSSEPTVSTNMFDQLASISDDPDISIAFSNFQAIDPASISALLDSPVRSEPQYDPQFQNQNQSQNQPQMILPLSYAPPNQQFNNVGSSFSIGDEIQMNDRTEGGLQFPMMAPSVSSLMPIQQSSQMQMQGEYNLRLQNSLFPQTIVPKINHEMQGYFGNGNNGNGYVSELDGMIHGLNVFNSPCHDQMRRIYSAGDMQMMHGNQNMIDGNMMGLQEQESSCFRVGRLTPEERKVKIERYIRKRNERNFKKKIKYACRKTLADSRPRVRGRFAKNDEFEEPRCMRSLSNESFDDDENSPLATVKEDENVHDSSRLMAMAHIGVNTLDYWSPDTTWSI